MAATITLYYIDRPIGLPNVYLSIFSAHSKVLVAHDKFEFGNSKVIEVIDLDDPQVLCKSFDLAEDCAVPMVGGEVRSKPLLCCVNLCYYLTSEGFSVRSKEGALTLNEARIRASASFPPSSGQWMLISGGYIGTTYF